jgi:glycosyltransferase involved in cell wall biosynthesis
MKRLLFVATEDWFVRSHFLALLHRAQTEGYEVIVAARDSGALSAERVRVIDTPFARGSLKPWELGRQVGHLRGLMQRERPDIVHAIGLKPIIFLMLTGYRDSGRVFAVIGRGFLAIASVPWTRFVNWRMKHTLRRALKEPRSTLLVENEDDRDWLGVGPAYLMPGAGVDPSVFVASSEPAAPPIVVGIVSRLVASKGIDVAVAAVERLRADGVPIVLRVAGGVDPENPAPVTEAELGRWHATAGVELVGAVSDVNAFWQAVHIACLPSRGGEGLPRSLLEAAACGRPVVTTETPGCRHFVRDGEDGILVAPNDVAALADAIRRLAADSCLRRRMGESGRKRVVDGYTLRHAADVAARAWRSVQD